MRPNQALRDEALAVFDRAFAITGALQLLAAIVAFIGVLSALLSLQLERGREFGLLRAVGLTVRQFRGLVLLETGLMGAAAGLLAMPTGLVLAAGADLHHQPPLVRLDDAAPGRSGHLPPGAGAGDRRRAAGGRLPGAAHGAYGRGGGVAGGVGVG